MTIQKINTSIKPSEEVDKINEVIDEVNSNVVHKTGNETIAGVKTFTLSPNLLVNVDDSRIVTQFTDIIKGTIPSTAHYAGFSSVDSNGEQFANCNCSYKNDGTYGCNFYVQSTTNSGSLGVYIDNNGKVYTKSPASDENNSIVTTVNKSKSANGHFKLGNGLIIQWGRSSTTDGYVTFPTPFSNACTAVIPTRISSGDAQSNIFENASTTRFKIKIYGGYSSSSYFYWIAVGY